MGQGLLRLAQVQEQLPEVTLGLGRGGFQPHGVAKLLQRGDLSPVEPERIAQVVASGPEVRGQPDRLLEMPECGVEIALGHER